MCSCSLHCVGGRSFYYLAQKGKVIDGGPIADGKGSPGSTATFAAANIIECCHSTTHKPVDYECVHGKSQERDVNARVNTVLVR